MSEARYRKLFIGGLNPGIDDDGLFEYFSQYGQVDDCFVLRDRRTGRHKSCGFVEFHTADAADAAQAARPHIFRNNEAQLKRAVPKEEFARLDGRMTSDKLFVADINDIQSHVLEEYFSQFGTIVHMDIIVNHVTGLRRGFAFVQFDDYDSVDKAMLGGPHTVAGRVLEVHKALTPRQIMLRRRRARPAPYNRPQRSNRNERSISPNLRMRPY